MLSLNVQHYDNGRKEQFYTIIDNKDKSPLECVIYNEQMDNIYKAIDKLPPRQKQCMVLIIENDMTDADIGRELNISREAVRQLRNKALLKLRKIVDEQAFFAAEDCW
jgi:RNA polymerase sigma factor (sigma-70 family)